MNDKRSFVVYGILIRSATVCEYSERRISKRINDCAGYDIEIIRIVSAKHIYQSREDIKIGNIIKH